MKISAKICIFVEKGLFLQKYPTDFIFVLQIEQNLQDLL